MTTFDAAVWRQRAWARLQRAQASGLPQEVIEPRWALEVAAIYDISTIIQWCTGRGITVKFEKRANGNYDYESQTIELVANAAPRRQVAYLLHECGHHLIGNKEHHERFGAGYPMQGTPHAERRLTHRVACLEEEFEAWHRGWNLARRLRLSISRAEFDAIRLECLKTYIAWAAKAQKPAKGETE